MTLPRLRFTKFQIAVHIGALLPLIILIWDYSQQNLTFNPIQEATLRTGKTALILLLLTLAATPINTVTGYRQVLRVRRALGLYAFLYAAIHFTIFSVIDYGLDLRLILLESSEKNYILVGFAALLILIPLAITSTKGWQRRLGKLWKKIHRWVYLAGVLVIIHYVWVVKSDIREPLVYGAILALLLLARIPRIRKHLKNAQAHWRPWLQRIQPKTSGARS